MGQKIVHHNTNKKRIFYYKTRYFVTNKGKQSIMYNDEEKNYTKNNNIKQIIFHGIRRAKNCFFRNRAKDITITREYNSLYCMYVTLSFNIKLIHIFNKTFACLFKNM